ncbi:peptide ABC transporter ATP-binding protein [Enemella evansiae]|uniref:ABC transporter ATP-binding protein n=1 Tax=Enemella evansiae TaxID=2016499 RepID=UPI000B977EC3|nr:ABC transporter ATP-binding protein [Enemella evansiae]OYN97369.1 peptide ABC transporter ATP-binding protein [Enemella evansiae]
MSAAANSDALLRLENITTEFSTLNGLVRGVNGASYQVRPGETLGVVGESGSGKSVTVMSALGLLPESAKVVAGHAWFDGADLLTMSQRRRAEVRGGEIGMIFQDPMTALNPVMTIGAQIDETLRRHSPDLRTKAQRRDRIIELLTEVGIPAPRQRIDQYPHQFSGGMRQRAMIAIAIANRPKLVIADEPTTALDVTVQAQILELLQKLQDDYGAALVMITHDLGVIAEVARYVVVMYAGRVVEEAPVDDIFHAPRHPYTVGLLESLPRVDDRREQLHAIAGQPPDPRFLPEGCAFQLRCRLSNGRTECQTQPPLAEVGPAHRSACHFHAELDGLDPSLITPTETAREDAS